MRTAIIVAHPKDVHAHAVATAVDALGGQAVTLDVNAFPREYNLETLVGKDHCDIVLSPLVGSIASLNVSGLWWRRLSYPTGGPIQMQDTDEVSSVVKGERMAALVGSLIALSTNAFNDLGRSRQAAHKPSQLTRARSLGLRVPETLITNNPNAVRNFIERLHGAVVYKMFRGAPSGAYGTRRLGSEELAILDRLTACPAIFQEHIPGAFDVRVVVVGHQLFAARIDFEPLTTVIDTRFVETAVSPFALPPALERQLLRLVSDFGLVYSSIDLRVTPEGDYVFFESNPEGQYLWLEIDAGLPISEALARRLLLMENPGRG